MLYEEDNLHYLILGACVIAFYLVYETWGSPAKILSQRNLETPENAPRLTKSSLEWPTLAVNSNDFTAINQLPPAQVIAYKTYRDV